MSNLENYGKELLNKNPEILAKRRIGIINNYQEFTNQILEELKLLNMENYEIKIAKKINQKGFYMKWHIDDAQLIKHNKENTKKNQIHVINRHYLHYNTDSIPDYTCLIYDSDYNIDFIGGTLEFADHTIIKPKRGMYVFFDSREVHKVNIIKSGIRENYLIKFYRKDLNK